MTSVAESDASPKCPHCNAPMQLVSMLAEFFGTEVSRVHLHELWNDVCAHRARSGLIASNPQKKPRTRRGQLIIRCGHR
jgi:hypothetical protein